MLYFWYCAVCKSFYKCVVILLVVFIVNYSLRKRGVEPGVCFKLGRILKPPPRANFNVQWLSWISIQLSNTLKYIKATHTCASGNISFHYKNVWKWVALPLIRCVKLFFLLIMVLKGMVLHFIVNVKKLDISHFFLFLSALLLTTVNSNVTDMAETVVSVCYCFVL